MRFHIDKHMMMPCWERRPSRNEYVAKCQLEADGEELVVRVPSHRHSLHA